MKATIIIQGLVQGVGFRFFTIEMARQYDIKGYTKNLPDGNVKVVAEGNEGLINEFIKHLKIGPRSSKVTGIDVKWDDNDFGFDTFDIRF